MTEQLINPITGKPADEVITQKEAESRGYRDLRFRFRHLEDENENFEYYRVDEKDIIVKLSRPHLNYKKPVGINHERVLQEDPSTGPSNNVCAIPNTDHSNDDETCLSCSG